MKKWIWLGLLCCSCEWSSRPELLQQHWNANHSQKAELYLQTNLWSGSEQLVLSLVNSSQRTDLMAFHAHHRHLVMSKSFVSLRWRGNDSLFVSYDDHLDRQTIKATPSPLVIVYNKL